jgi:disulfide bond formation protein DsbB
MDTRTLTTLFTILSILCFAGVAGWLILWIAALASPRAADVRAVVVASLDGPAIALAWIVALVSSLGSLYYSEVANFEPCNLCWYQRIAMYPLAVILGIAAATRDRLVRRYAYPLAGIGAVIAGYNYLLHHFPSLETAACGSRVSCTSPYVWRLGFVSLPLMAMAGFLVILVLLWTTNAADRIHRAAEGPYEYESTPSNIDP